VPTVLVLLASGVVAVIGVLLPLPQLVRLLRTRDAAGLSPAGWANGSVSFVAWTAYLAVEQSWPLLVATVIAAPPWFAITVLVLRYAEHGTARVWAPVATWLATLGLFATLALWTPGPLAAALGLSALWSLGPSLLELVRAVDLSGVSAGTWWLVVVEGVANLVAGWGDTAPVVYGVLVASFGSAALVTLTVRRNPGRTGHDAPASSTDHDSAASSTEHRTLTTSLH
jgi:uncharacterized protein with PQ loop repeat